MIRYVCLTVLGVTMAALAACAQAPYVGANEADNEFYRITAADMAVISAKKGIFTSRSFGQNVLDGVDRMRNKNPMYGLFYTRNMLNLWNYPTSPTTLDVLPTGFYAAGSSYAPNNKILHFLACMTTFTTRLDHVEYYLSNARYQYANDVNFAFIEYHPDSAMANVASFNSYKARLETWKTTFPNMKTIYVTAGLWPKVNDAQNEAAWAFSSRVMDPANGLLGNVPILDWRSLLSMHPDGTSAGHMMCLEFNTGDATHPNNTFAEERLGRAFLLMLYKMYCNPGLTANAGFDRTVLDADSDGSQSVTLDGSGSYASVRPLTDPGRPNIVRYVWREGATVLSDSAASAAAVNLALGTHTLTLCVTDDRVPAQTSSDTVVVTVSQPSPVIANAGLDQQIIDANGSGNESVGLDGGGSSCPGGAIASYVWSEAGKQIGTGMMISPSLIVGVHEITLTVTDNAVPPHSDTDTVTITVLEPMARISSGLQALYTFKEGAGTTVTDTSGVGAPLNLTVGTAGAVSWVAGGGLKVNSAVLIASPAAATKIYDACRSVGEITLEAWVKPTSAVQNGPAAILTMSADHANRNFTLGQGLYAPQSAAAYHGRLRATGQTNNGEPAIVTPDGAATTNLQHVVLCHQGNGTSTLYVNGAPQASGIQEGLFQIWDGGYRLALANEIIGGQPWLGTYSLAAIYNRALTVEEVGRNYQVGLSPTTPLAPQIMGWQSVLCRGALAEELQSLVDNYVEPRCPGLNVIRVTLSKPVNPATVLPANLTVTGVRGGNLASRIVGVTQDATGRVLTITFAALPAADRITIALGTAIRDQWNQSIVGDRDIIVCSLTGDVDRSGGVTEADIMAVRAAVGQSAGGANASHDVDGSGEITNADLQAIRSGLGNTLP